MWIFRVFTVIFPTHLFLKCRWTLLKLKSYNNPRRRRNVEKMWCKLCKVFKFYQPLFIHSTWWSADLLSINCILCIYSCIFQLGVVPYTEFEDHNRKLSLQKLSRMTQKKDKMRIWCNFVLITGTISIKNTPKYLLHDYSLSNRMFYRGSKQATTKFPLSSSTTFGKER